MISYLTGQPILEKDFVTILVNGVGYGVRVTVKTRELLATQPLAELFVYTHVREDALELFGFPDRTERELFLLLLSVSGVGPKTALNIVEVGSNTLVRAVQEADVSVFSAVPRVGKKVAQKIIIELKSKLGSLKELDLGPTSAQHQDVTEALLALGFAEHDIQKALQEIPIEELSLSDAVRKGIQTITTGSH